MERQKTLSTRERVKSFLDGAATVFDLSGRLSTRRTRKILSRSDANALRSDWEAVGRDMQTVINRSEVKPNKNP